MKRNEVKVLKIAQSFTSLQVKVYFKKYLVTVESTEKVT
jgi:hypothetical protein